MRGPDENGFRVIRTTDITPVEILETVFQKGGYDAGSLVLDPVTQLSVGVRYIDHATQIHYFDESLAALQARLMRSSRIL